MPKAAERLTRRATNVSLDETLVAEARELDINLSRACERGLAEQIGETRAERWRAENAEAIEAWNSYFEENGLPLAKFRQF